MNFIDIVFNIFIIAFLLFVNGFFVAAEFSLVKVRKTRLEQLINDGNRNAKRALKLVNDVNKMLAAAQLGVTIASIALGWVAEATIVQLIKPVIEIMPFLNGHYAAHAISVPISFVLVTYFHVLLGEQLPKCLALRHTDTIALAIATPMDMFITIFKPFVWLLQVSGDKILCAFHANSSDASLVHSTEELDMLVDASYNEGVLNETEAEMLHNMFKFSDLMAKQVMIPRTDMICVPDDVTYDEINKLALENGYTRYPVYEKENIDKIIGFIHVKDLYAIAMTKEEYSLKGILRPIVLVPETITLDNLMKEFKKTHIQMAVVVDEFGGTAGLITLEDVLEEIIGEVQDEFDEEEIDIRQIGENRYLANAIMRLDELAEFLGVKEDFLDDEDVDTIAGFVVKLLGRIAEVGDSVSFKNLTFTVKEIDGARITKLEIYKENKVEETNTDDA